MEIFSEIYGCYYQVVDRILKEAETRLVTRKEMEQICTELGFAESSLYILPRLTGREWPLLSPDEGGGFHAVTKGHKNAPLTSLQRSWLKTLLADSRFRLFFEDEDFPVLEQYVEDAAVLWEPGDFHYYDQFSGGDRYGSPSYRKHFCTLLSAIAARQYVAISYQSRKGQRITHHFLPLKLEYSAKNDQFRLLALPKNNRHSIYLQIINIDSIQEIHPLPVYDEEEVDFVSLVRKSYYREPVRLLITNQRNALERAMLHFANYEKKTRKTGKDTWECLIYYNSSMETELLIEILSFGPAIRVTGPEAFLAQIKERIGRQIRLTAREASALSPP